MTGVAVLLDVATWQAGAEPDESHQTARAVLAGAGWRIVALPAETPLASVWPDAGRSRAIGGRYGDGRYTDYADARHTLTGGAA
jgi:hypothetical protein